MKTLNKIKTRFAPSPTGYMHIGNIRTALFCWLYAKKNNGDFFLRIDDTDAIRNSKKYTQNIIDILNWVNIKSKKSVIFQSHNFNKYKSNLKKLLKENKAYKCFCKKERLNKLKLEQLKNKKKIIYDGFCRERKNKKKYLPFVIRFKNSKSKTTEFNDLIKGKIKIPNSEINDFIIAKKNFIPTYNFASAIDDISLKISDVIRGEDHVSNTIKQINIMKALNSNIPRFIHLPMILDENKKILSKRNKKTHIAYYKKNGLLTEALLNYIIRLGWSYKNKEIFSINEMIKLFDVNNINKSASIVNIKKLIWLNKYFIKKTNLKTLIKHLNPIKNKILLNYHIGPSIEDLIKINKQRSDTLKDIIVNNSFLYKNNIYVAKKYDSYFSEKTIKIIHYLYKEFKSKLYEWSENNIKKSIKKLIKKKSISLKEIAIPLRIIITGHNESNPIYELIFFSGRVLILKKFLNIMNKQGL